MKNVEVVFRGIPGDEKDLLIHKLAEDHGVDLLGGGTFLGEVPERDLEFEGDDMAARRFAQALREAGFDSDVYDPDEENDEEEGE